ncbi:MAG: peptide ABC transporter substrate-binding protein [Clostridiales bacterium]|nr:peptide ABC transporter substrate-binding protein [Clostridiales bacterium]
MKKRFISIFLCVCFTLALFSSCKSKNKYDTIRFPISSDPLCLDPQIAVGTPANIVINNCFEGLVRIGEGGKIIPGVAKSWSVSSDSLTYTFNLRTDAKWFLPKDLEDTLGEDYEKTFDDRVTANDFVFALKRAIDPNTNAPNATTLYAIKNAQEIHSGNMSVDKLGVTAIDKYTLQIKLDYSSLNFLSVLSTPIAMPCSEAFFEKTSGRYGLSTKLLICNGPFYLRVWEKDTKLFLGASKTYKGNDKVVPTGVRLIVNPDSTTYFSNLTGEGYDAAPISFNDVSSLPSDMNFKTDEYKNIVWSLCFNNNSSFLSNEDFRLALCHSTNLSVMQSKSSTKAEGIVPSSCSIVPGVSYRAGSNVITLSNYDVDLAKNYWKKYIDAENSPEITLSLLCVEEHKTLIKKLIQDWQDVFGIEFSVSIVTMEKSELKKRIYNGNYELAFAPVFADEFLASEFLNRFGTGSFGNVANYSSPTYDAMLENIRKAKDKDSLLSMCKEAEKHLINDGIIFPVYFENSYITVNANVEGLYFYPSGENVTFIKAHHKS